MKEVKQGSKEESDIMYKLTVHIYIHTHSHTLLQGIKHFEVHLVPLIPRPTHLLSLRKLAVVTGEDVAETILGPVWDSEQACMHTIHMHVAPVWCTPKRSTVQSLHYLNTACKSPPGLSKLSQSLHGLQWTRTKILLLLFNIIMMSLGPR